MKKRRKRNWHQFVKYPLLFVQTQSICCAYERRAPIKLSNNTCKIRAPRRALILCKRYIDVNSCGWQFADPQTNKQTTNTNFSEGKWDKILEKVSSRRTDSSSSTMGVKQHKWKNTHSLFAHRNKFESIK